MANFITLTIRLSTEKVPQIGAFERNNTTDAQANNHDTPVGFVGGDATTGVGFVEKVQKVLEEQPVSSKL